MNVEEVQEVMKILSDNLQKELRRDVFKTYMKNLQFLEQTFSQECLENLYERIEENMYSPQEVIISETDEQAGEPQDACLYLIVKGNVCITQNSKIIRTLQQNDHFGEIQFLCGQKSSLGARSVGYSTVMTIKRQDLVSIVNRSCEEDKQKFKNLMDILNFSLKYDAIDHECFICGEFNHITSQCSKVHLDIDKLQLVKADNIKQIQLRNSFKRFKIQKYSTRLKSLEVEFKVCDFIADMIDAVENYEQSNNLVGNEDVQNEQWKEYQKEQETFYKQYEINILQPSQYSSYMSQRSCSQFNNSYM